MSKNQKEHLKTILGILLFCAFAGMFLAGALSQEIQLVFAKAMKICLECIGIG